VRREEAMCNRHWLYGFVLAGVVAAISLGITPSALAAEQPDRVDGAASLTAQLIDRVVWRHDEGHFENTRGNHWTEVSPNGTFYFREVYRGMSYIELYDASRDCRVRLTSTACYVKSSGGPYRLFYFGHWER
jgi:hypothetical protein